MEEAAGDVLVFLTGQDEIESMERLLRDRAAGLPPSKLCGLRLTVVPIYASMPPEQQMKVGALRGVLPARPEPASEGDMCSAARPARPEPASEGGAPVSSPMHQVFEPAAAGFRKVILATNIAETSITIGGVR